MWCSAQGKFLHVLGFVQQRWGNTGGPSAECLSEPGALLRHNVLLDLGRQLWLYDYASFGGIPIANANLDPVNNLKKQADVAAVHMLSSKMEAAIISVRTTKMLSWRLCISNIKISELMIGFINMNINLAPQCVCINGADTLETPPNVSWFMAEAITSRQCTDAWWANRCR